MSQQSLSVSQHRLIEVGGMSIIRRYRGYVTLSLVFVLAFGGYVLYDRLPRPAPVEIIIPSPTPTHTPMPLQVHVTGAVVHPGVYALPPNSRLVDAIRAAGGMLANADPGRLNLAAFLQDSQQIAVPCIDAPMLAEPPRRATGTLSMGAAGTGTAGKININEASAAELEALPGIGPALAQRILDERQANGPFQRSEDITRVNGIGPSCCERIAPLICVR